MTNLTPVQEGTAQDTRLALYYEQRERILARARAEAATCRENGTVFISILLKTVLSFNGAAILGYPVFVQYIPDALHTEDTYRALELLLKVFLFSFVLAMIAAFFMHLRWEFASARIQKDEEADLAQLNHFSENTLDLNLLQSRPKDLEKMKHKGRIFGSVSYGMHIFWIIFIFMSAAYTVATIIGASMILKLLPTP